MTFVAIFYQNLKQFFLIFTCANASTTKLSRTGFQSVVLKNAWTTTLLESSFIPDIDEMYSDSSQHPRLGSMVLRFITASQTWINGSVTHHSIPDLDQWFSDSSQHPRHGSMVQWLITASQTWINGSVTHHSIPDLDQWFSDSSQHPRLGSMVQWLITASQTWINGSVTHHSMVFCYTGIGLFHSIVSFPAILLGRKLPVCVCSKLN